jgi:hypothetical protein
MKFKKGQSGNPKGKPKGTRNRSTIVREILESAILGETVAGLTVTMPVIEAMTHALAAKAIKHGDVQAFNSLADSAFGKLTDKVETAHTITRMGSVEIGSGDQAKALEFNVGKPADTVPDDSD